MGYAMGWLVVVAALAGAPQTKPAGPEIKYQVKLVEVRGLKWRQAPGCCLKPVAHKNGVTIWTAPQDVVASLSEGTVENTIAAPKVIAATMSPAHVTTRKDHPFITQVSWNGRTGEPRGKTETVREGMALTIAGRCIDQGVLTHLVIEDTGIHSVHTVNLDSPAAVRQASREAAGNGCATATAANSCASACPASGNDQTRDAEACKTSLGGETGKECCAGDAAECQAGKTAATASCGAKEVVRTAQIQIPEVGHAEASGEWLIPRDEVLVVGFGPHTVADKDGKAAVRERIALITAEKIEDPSEVRSARMTVPSIPTPTHVAVPAPAPVPPPARTALAAPMAIPALPSRSIPQGIHADGTPAELPPLPEDEKAETQADESSQPMPSAQTKPKRSAESDSSAAPEPKPSAKPTTAGDAKTSKASFNMENPLLKAASLFPLARGARATTRMPTLPLPLPNLRFMVPLKPFSLKLPLNQKLELELIGRVVPDADIESSGVLQE